MKVNELRYGRQANYFMVDHFQSKLLMQLGQRPRKRRAAGGRKQIEYAHAGASALFRTAQRDRRSRRRLSRIGRWRTFGGFVRALWPAISKARRLPQVCGCLGKSVIG